MRKIQAENLEDGMILARDVCATSGNVLLGKGTQLSAAMGRRLKNWGIGTVYIEGDEEAVNQESTSTISPEEIKKHLESKFSRVIGRSVMQEIFAAVYKFKTNQNKS